MVTTISSDVPVEAVEHASPSMRNFALQWGLKAVIEQHARGDHDFKVHLEDDEELPSEIPSSYRYDTADVVREYHRNLIEEAVATAINGQLQMEALLAKGGLLDVYRHHVARTRAAGQKPYTYASFLYHVASGWAQIEPLRNINPDRVAEHVASIVVDALDAGDFDRLLRLQAPVAREA